MPLIFVVRHGRATDYAEPDPGLDETGHQQAQIVAGELQQRIAAAELVSSPLRRCRETAAPLAAAWGVPVRIEPRVAEVPSPQLQGLARRRWLREVLPSTWAEVARGGEAIQPGYAATLAAWRAALHDAVLECQCDTVIHSHFVVINSLVGLSCGDERLNSVMPDNGSLTVFEASGRHLRLLEIGRSMAPDVG